MNIEKSYRKKVTGNKSIDWARGSGGHINIDDINVPVQNEVDHCWVPVEDHDITNQ